MTDFEEPQSTVSLWGDVFGMGGFFKMITDPALGAKAFQMMQAITESAQASRRIEIKLNMLLEALGHELPKNCGNLELTALPASDRSDGNRGFAVAGKSLDDGTSVPAPGHDVSGKAAGNGRDHR